MTSLPTLLPTPPAAVARHTAPAPARRGSFVGLVVTVLALVIGGVVTIATLPAPAPVAVAAPAPPVTSAPVPPAPSGGSTLDEVPRFDPVDRITVDALPLTGGCPRKGCTVRHRLGNSGPVDVAGMFTVRVGKDLVDVVPLTLPPGGSAEISTWLPGKLVAAQPGTRLQIVAEFRVVEAGMTV